MPGPSPEGRTKSGSEGEVGPVTTQNVPFVENEKPQVVENIGGRDRGRTGDLIVANDGKKFIRRSAATTYAF